MVAIVAPETPRPVTMTYVMGVGSPRDLHGEENTSIVYGRDGEAGLIEFSFLISENLVEMFAVIPFDRLPYSLMGALLVGVSSQQSLHGKLFDPGQFGRNVPPLHCLVDRPFRWKEYVRGPIVAMHTIHQVDRELLQFIFLDLDLLVLVNHFRAIRKFHFYPGNLLKLVVRRPEVYLVMNNHMPVNPRPLTQFGHPTSCLHQQA
jgi:hypothetical protein